MKTGKTNRICLLAALLVLALAVALTVPFGRQEAAADADVKLRAAKHMAACMARIGEYKQDRGIPRNDADIHQSDLIGDYFTEITTTVGDIAAKRTVSDPNMAALMVELLSEAGVRKGDAVAAGFSGSFPGMNLAAICACEAMGVRLIYIASVGASMYGANQPALTFPDMAFLLAQDGWIATYPAAFSMGGDWDCGKEMDPACAELVRQRLKAYGIPFLEEPDLEKNLLLRRGIFEHAGAIACYVGVGGNITNSGKNGSALSEGVVPPTGTVRINKDSGLLDVYHAEGLTVINVIQIRALAAKYGFAFDPETQPEIGTGGVYRRTVYPVLPGICGILLAAAVLFYPRCRKRRETE